MTKSNSVHSQLILTVLAAVHAHGTVLAQESGAAQEAVIQVAPGTSAHEVIAGTGLHLTCSCVAGELLLVSDDGGADEAVFQGWLAQVEAGADVFFTEALRRNNISESSNCGPAGDFGSQQCTIGFVDGQPQNERYLNQDVLAPLQLEEAQALSENRGCIVAVIDTGVDLSHPALVNNLMSEGYDFINEMPGAWDRLNGVDDDGDGVVDEAYGHGTHISGIIALINPDVMIIPYRVAGADGTASSFNVARAIRRAVDEGADMINLSVSALEGSLAVEQALLYAHDRRVSVFTSAGNTGASGVLFPGATRLKPDTDKKWDFKARYIYAVAALDETGARASFSSWGKEVDLVTSGTGIYSTYPGGNYAWWGGTSMSSAVACGCASLVQSCVGSEAGDRSAAEILLRSAEEFESPAGGAEIKLGNGPLNALTALQEALAGDSD